MEDLKCIANETFPSIMDHSLASHTSEILDNVTISSNLGLPVAASTEIRQKTQSHDRLYDQSSYMERRLSDPLASSCCVEFKSDLRKKLMLNFQDPVETTECCLMSDKNKPDCLQRKENQSCVDESSTDNQDSPCEIFSPKQLEDLTTKIFTSLEKRSQGHKAVVLEPKQKWLTSETGDNAVTSLSRLIENEKLMSFASMEANSTDDEIGDEEFSNDELEAYFEHLVLPEIDDVDDQDLGEYINAMEVSSDQEKFQIPEVNKEVRTDSPLVSDEELSDFKVEGFDVKDEQFMLPVITRKEGSCMKSSSRAGPNSTADKSHVGIVGDSSQMCRRTTHEACLDVEGYLDCGMQDGKSLKMNAVIESRNDVTDMTNSAFKLDSVYFNCAEHNKDVSEIWHTEERTNSPPKSQVADETHVPLAEVYLSPSAPGRAEQDQCIVVGDPPHNVVYQNEEGRWVTDLAYYTSFNKEEESDHSNISGDFISGSDAIAMIAQDQEDFEREHRFIQEEKMDLSNTSGLGDFSWKSVSNLNPLRTSQTDFSKDAGYLRLTLGEFFGQRSEALGCLGGGGDVKRPSFGYRITSPQKRQPVPLLRRSDISMANSDKQNLQMSDTLPDFSSLGDVEKSTKEESHIVSATFAPGEMDTPCRENTSENHEGRKIEEKQHSDIEPFPLSISTIASAIANASVSAEPSQLAALMMKLSDIHREGTNIPEIGKVTDLSVINQLLSNNTENSPFDIEKYLRRTDETENDSEPENTIKDEGITTDCHKLLCKQESESANAGDLSKNSFNTKCRKEKQHLEKILEENIFRGSHCVISPKQKKEIENTEATSNIGESFHSEKLSRIPGSKTDLFENDNFCSEDSATIPICPNKEKSMPQVKYQHNQNGKILKGNAPCNNEKHVAFENVSPDHKKVVGAAIVLTEQTLATPVPSVISDDDQCSFRPSTSPLIHSSPSEASESALSGSDWQCTTPNFKDLFCKDKMLPQTEYSDPSLGRLTFISATENTLKALAVSDPERSNRASELSTTIVWTSPTSLLEGNTGKNTTLQKDKQTSQVTITENYTRKQEVNESPDPAIPEDQKSSGENPLKNRDQSEKNCGNNRGQLDTPAVRHDCAYTTDRLKSVPGYNDLYGCISLSQGRANFRSDGAASPSSGIPTLLTGCSLRTTPFAQQYLGGLPSHTTVALPQYHVGFSSALSLPAGLIYSTIPLGHIQNSLTTGMTLGADAGAGVLGTASHQNLISSQNVYNSTSCTRQTFDVGGRPGQWEEPASFGFAHVKVPEEVKFPNACCVGLTSHSILSILNPSERWLQVSISLLSVMLNGIKMEPQKHRCLLFKNKTVIGPCATEELKLLFLPCQAGVYQCLLSVASWPFSADADVIVQAEVLSARVIVNAVAENPDIEVETGETNHLDFGDLPSGTWKVLPLKLTNKTCARVPIRLVIHANAIAWRCFTFCKEPVDPSVKGAVPYNISQLAAPSVISRVMNASYDGQDPEVLVIWVQFRAPNKCISSDCLGPADEYFARIDVEIDCPEPANVLRSIPLSARSGTPRIYAPKSLQTLYLSAKMGSSAKQQLPLKNAGNIKVDLKIMMLETDGCISVKPEYLFLIPGEEQEVTVEFLPKDCGIVESTVKILVLPSGPEYKVTVKGEVTVMENKPVIQKSSNTEDPPILSNKQFLSWGGVQLGRTVQQKLILRNDSVSTTQQLRLLIRGQDQDCFQLKLGEQAYNNCEIKIRPKHDYSVFLTFTPTRFACMFAKLEMKQLGLLSQLGIKFTIPLYGYGGKSSVKLEDVKRHGNKYILELYERSPDKTCQASFTIYNTGCRAAYVKALCFKNLSEIIVMDPNVMRLFPEKFILKEGSLQKVTVRCGLTEEQSRSSVLSTICLFYGDEVLRQQYCRVTQHHQEQLQKLLPANNAVINVKFNEKFPGEELVTEVYDLPQQPNDIQCFFTNMRRITVCAVKVSAVTSDTNPSSVYRVELERPAAIEKHSMTLDVLPVKGPHGCALSTDANGQDENKFDSRDTWTLQPTFLILAAPSQSGTITKYTEIINNSNRTLTFELSWPAHCLTITPQLGIIEPGNTVSIHVSPNPSLAENKSIFPWSGLIYIHCDGVQKLVRVQIREDSSEEQSGKSSLAVKARVQQQPELPIIHIQPLQKLPLTKLEVKNRTVCFPETRSGATSEKYLEIENNGDENVKWLLSSFAPPYVKDVDEGGEVYRATYTAFCCSCLSGTIEAHGKEKVVVIFLPRDRGHYSQFWDLECHPLHDPHMKDKHRLQFCGMGILGKEKMKNGSSPPALVKINVRDISQRKECPVTFDHKIRKGVCPQEDVYTFPPTRIGESSTLKISMRNYSTSANKLKFRNPKAPFYIKHSNYTLRCHHYCNLPVQFKPIASGTFKGLLVVETDKSGIFTIQLTGEGFG